MRKLVVLIAAAAALAVPAPASAQGLDLTCGLALTRLDATTTNVLAVDTNAIYWGVPYAAVPGTRLRIEGAFPHARYTSWNVYDSLGKPNESIADLEIRPDAGSSNPFLPAADRLAQPRSYTLFVEFGPKPANPAPNTLYTDAKAGTILYRIYIPDQGRDAKGGVPLPKVSLEPRGSTTSAAGLGACRQIQAPFAQQVNDLIANAPGLPDPTDDSTGYPGRNPPDWELFTNLGESAVDILLDNDTGGDYHDQAQQAAPDGAGFFSNRDISYVFTGTSRGFGELLVLEGRAPTFADTRAGARTMPSGAQLRYFSFCQYEPASQRVIDCLSDDRITVRPDGSYRIVVSTAAQRPSNARAECGNTWLPWGPASQGLLIYRHMLADPSFAQAIQRVPAPGQEEATMGEYTPRARYLPGKAAFEAQGC